MPLGVSKSKRPPFLGAVLGACPRVVFFILKFGLFLRFWLCVGVLLTARVELVCVCVFLVVCF
ncbi:hypothetical protein F5Y01DRAFT_296384 [Xylaria sp. FL0043]|nr:hypothetical protein F5Y01DRAFT_296384 [Xylaria sp. FL0043]